MEAFLQVGVISSTHGLKGEVKVFPTTTDIERFKVLKEVILDTGREQLSLEVEHVKFFKKMVILKFKNFNHINDIEKYKGKSLLVPREDAISLKEGEHFIVDLIGLTVVTDLEEKLGILTEVLETGANDVYVVTGEDKQELLIPAIKQCILKVNIEEGFMQVHLLDGLR